MSDVLAVNKTKFDALDTGDNYIGSGEFQTDVRCIKDSYEAAALAIGSTIKIADLPLEGAKIVDIVVYHDALGASSTIEVGDSTSSARYASAADTSAAGRFNLDEPDGFNYKTGTVAGDNVILLTSAGGTLTGTIKVLILYTV